MRVLIASLFLGTALLAGAQDAVRVQVPFDFHVSGQTLPAGTYRVERVFPRDNALLQIVPAQGGAVSFLTIPAGTPHPGTALSFHRYGDSYFLSGVTTSSGNFTLHRSKEERQLAMKGSGDDVGIGGSK
jgi:hypothetical protein